MYQIKTLLVGLKIIDIQNDLSMFSRHLFSVYTVHPLYNTSDEALI